MCVHMNYTRRYENKGCPLFDRVSTYTIRPQSHQVLDYVSNPGSLTFMKLLVKRGPSFEQGWVECLFHVEPVWNSVALAGSHLEFHIQTTQSFRVKLKDEGKQTKRPHNNDKAGKDDLLEFGMTVFFHTHLIVAPLDSPAKLVLPSAMPNQGFPALRGRKF